MAFGASLDGTSVFLNQIVWAPPDPPHGLIIHFNVKISSVINETEVYAQVEGVNDTFLDVRPYVLSDGVYLIQVNSITIFGWVDLAGYCHCPMAREVKLEVCVRSCIKRNSILAILPTQSMGGQMQSLKV